jgi:hypothetical protein
LSLLSFLTMSLSHMSAAGFVLHRLLSRSSLDAFEVILDFPRRHAFLHRSNSCRPLEEKETCFGCTPRQVSARDDAHNISSARCLKPPIVGFSSLPTCGSIDYLLSSPGDDDATFSCPGDGTGLLPHLDDGCLAAFLEHHCEPDFHQLWRLVEKPIEH